MASRITAAGESLIAQLQAAGEPLVIDRFIFAYVDGQISTDPIPPGAGIPEGSVVLEYDIPSEYRAFAGPNQVVYSALLGSDVGNFSLNWQGLYCSKHETLIAVSTFPSINKDKADAATGQSGNNITRNFIIEFTGAREATAINVEARTWQLDFSVRLAGIDERERLSNRDIHGRASFMEGGWKLGKEGGEYRFSPGVGYVEGIRLHLSESLLLLAPSLPCTVWLDVALEPSGSDIAAVVQPLTSAPDEELADYTTGAPYNTPHYLVKLAAIDADGNISELREQSLLSQLGGVGEVSTGNAGYAPALNGNEGDVLTIQGERAVWGEPMKTYELCEFYLFRHPALRPGFQPAQGGLLADAATLYPEAWAYLQSTEGQLLCKTEAEWQAMTTATWHTLADGTQIGWNGIGGAPFYAPNFDTGALRLPDLRGMYAEAAGFDALGVGDVHGWGLPPIRGGVGGVRAAPPFVMDGAFFFSGLEVSIFDGQGTNLQGVGMDTSRVLPSAVRVQVPAWGALACVYLGAPR